MKIEEVHYGEFSRRFHDKVVEGHIPVDGTIELTYRCNLACKHCYCSQDPLREEMGRDEICRYIDGAVEEGCLWLLMTGGEPLVRADFLDIYTYAVRKGMLVTLFTNGTLITPSIADHLKEYTPFNTEITLYGRTKETYEKVTGVKGSFDLCMNGIRLLLERGVPLKLKSMAMTLNHHELPQMKEYAEKLGVEFRFDSAINARLDGSKEPCFFRLSPEKVVELDITDDKRRLGWREFCDKFWNSRDSDRIFTCAAGSCSFHLDPYGRLRACEMVTLPSYDLRAGSFKEGWHDFIPKVISQKRIHVNKCKGCEVRPICDLCPGWSLLEHGDPEEPVDYLCRIAHLRAEAFGMVGSKQNGGGYGRKEGL